MTTQTGLAILHWIWTAFFAGFGIYLLFRPDCMMRCSCKFMRLKDEADAERLTAAVERRQAAEHISSATGYAASAFSFVMAAIAAFTSLAPGLLYAMFCLGLAMTMTGLYLQLRNSQPTRIAVLSARVPGAVIPVWAFVLGGISALAALSLAAIPSLAAAASIVFVSTAITLFAAWRLTSLPAMLQGVDVPVETLLDQRLRFYRSAGVLILGIVQPFVFCSQILEQKSQAIAVAYFVTLAVWLVYTLWVMRKMFVKVSLASQ